MKTRSIRTCFEFIIIMNVPLKAAPAMWIIYMYVDMYGPSIPVSNREITVFMIFSSECNLGFFALLSYVLARPASYNASLTLLFHG
jgi:hypothetical protein